MLALAFLTLNVPAYMRSLEFHTKIERKERGSKRKGKERRKKIRRKHFFLGLFSLANDKIERFCPKSFSKSSPSSPTFSGDSTKKTGFVTQKYVFQCQFWYVKG